MESLKINIRKRGALAILQGLEQAGLISIHNKEEEEVEEVKKHLSKQLRGGIAPGKAKKMMQYIDKERTEWERY